jgi:hypothetical protein
MDSTNKLFEVIVQQGQNVLASMKDLKLSAKQKGKERADKYERFGANQHSFEVYTYIDSAIEQLAEVQEFQHKLGLFYADFTGVFTNYDIEVDLNHIEITYEEVITAYDAMVNALNNN